MDRSSALLVAYTIVLLGSGYLIAFNSGAFDRPIEIANAAESTINDFSGATVAYADSGFSPQELSVPLGSTVTFVNHSSSHMQVASDPFPTNRGYDGSSKTQHCAMRYNGPVPFDSCRSSPLYRFTFHKTGVWNYHDHEHPDRKGRIIVTVTKR